MIIALRSELMGPYVDLSGISAYIIGSIGTPMSVGIPVFRSDVTILQSVQKRTKKKDKMFRR